MPIPLPKTLFRRARKALLAAPSGSTVSKSLLLGSDGIQTTGWYISRTAVEDFRKSASHIGGFLSSQRFLATPSYGVDHQARNDIQALIVELQFSGTPDILAHNELRGNHHR